MSGAALITGGANSALGMAFARRLAAQGYQRLILTGRDTDALARSSSVLESEFSSVVVETLAADLKSQEDRQRIIDRMLLTDPGPPVSLLINNAGIGVAEEFHASDWEAEQDMLTVNYTAPVHLIHGVLPTFLRRRHGRILNVCSIAGLVPDGSYGAAKTGLIAFSRWAHATYKSSGVHITALCPGLMDTDFHANTGVDVSSRPRWAFTEVDEVATSGLAVLQEGRKAVYVPGRSARALARSARFVPDQLVAAVTKKRKL